MVLALGADVHVGFKVGLPDRLPTARTLDPQALCTDALLLVAVVASGTVELTVLAFKPDIASVIIARPGCDCEFVVRRSKSSKSARSTANSELRSSELEQLPGVVNRVSQHDLPFAGTLTGNSMVWLSFFLLNRADLSVICQFSPRYMCSITPTFRRVAFSGW